jgi:hypothetical protein
LPKWPENCFEPFGKGGWPPIYTWIIGPLRVSWGVIPFLPSLFAFYPCDVLCDWSLLLDSPRPLWRSFLHRPLWLYSPVMIVVHLISCACLLPVQSVS